MYTVIHSEKAGWHQNHSGHGKDQLQEYQDIRNQMGSCPVLDKVKGKVIPVLNSLSTMP
jgi:hypothetical protein